MKRIAIYARHDPQGSVPEYVVYKLERLREHVGELVVVCSGAVTPTARTSLERVADVVHVRETRGFDTWAYRCGMGDVVGWEKLAAFLRRCGGRGTRWRSDDASRPICLTT
jgi:lipopolysaccharide biosynthesis protein